MKKKTRATFRIALLFVLFLVLFVIGKSYWSTRFFFSKDRINFVLYGQDTALFSLGIKDGTNYFIPFDADTEVMVPGGYEMYRIGALGKLAYLEKKPDLFRMAFSNATKSFVDIYFYPKKSDIYYHKTRSSYFFPSIPQLLFDTSNASFLERIYIISLLLERPRNSFKTFIFTDSASFYKQYLGNFYSSSYRAENLNVQIIYSKKYETAVMIGQILEGEGIRVGDISQLSESEKRSTTYPKNCLLEENGTGSFSQTARSLELFYGCQLRHGTSHAYDILFTLGDINENAWEIDSSSTQ